MQIIVHCKGKIGFAAAKINNADGTVFRQFIDHILDKFQIPVDLTEFIKSRPGHPAVRGLHAQSYQEIHWFSFL